MRFNSLQTGTHIQRQKGTIRWGNPEGFNSLQTGKHIQSLAIEAAVNAAEVSIPFKRESIYKVTGLRNFTMEDVFQFPSNGKAYPKDT